MSLDTNDMDVKHSFTCHVKRVILKQSFYNVMSGLNTSKIMNMSYVFDKKKKKSNNKYSPNTHTAPPSGLVKDYATLVACTLVWKHASFYVNTPHANINASRLPIRS